MNIVLHAYKERGSTGTLWIWTHRMLHSAVCTVQVHKRVDLKDGANSKVTILQVAYTWARWVSRNKFGINAKDTLVVDCYGMVSSVARYSTNAEGQRQGRRIRRTRCGRKIAVGLLRRFSGQKQRYVGGTQCKI